MLELVGGSDSDSFRLGLALFHVQPFPSAECHIGCNDAGLRSGLDHA